MYVSTAEMDPKIDVFLLKQQWYAIDLTDTHGRTVVGLKWFVKCCFMCWEDNENIMGSYVGYDWCI